MSNGRQNFFVNDNISSIRSATPASTDLLGSFLLRWNKINKKDKKDEKDNSLPLSWTFVSKNNKKDKKIINHLSVGLSTDRIRRHLPKGSRPRGWPGHKGSQFCQRIGCFDWKVTKVAKAQNFVSILIVSIEKSKRSQSLRIVSRLIVLIEKLLRRMSPSTGTISRCCIDRSVKKI